MREFVSVEALGLTDNDDDEIVISLYGPRGGSRACESLSLENAKRLIAELTRAISSFEPDSQSYRNAMIAAMNTGN